MNEILFFTVCAFGASCISSYVILGLIQWIEKGWKFFTVLVFNACLLALSYFFYYPYSKIITVVIDVLLLNAILNHKKPQFPLIAVSLLLGVCELIVYPIQVFITLYINRVPNLNVWSLSISLLFPQFLILYVHWLYQKIATKSKEKHNLFVSLLQVIILPIFTIINNIVMIMMSSYYMDPLMLFFILMDMIFVVFLNVYLCYLFEKTKENVRLKQQAIRLEEMGKMQYTYYQRLEDKYDQSRALIHDMKRHLQVLENKELPQDHLQTYLGDMKGLLHRYAHEVYSTHPIINIILHEKFEEAKENGIQVTCSMAPIDFTFIKEIDLTVIFANLLDNAIDACVEVEGEKKLMLKVDQVHDFIVILIQNTSKPYVETKHSSKQGHSGLGLKNVSQTLETYGGNMQVEPGEQDFTIHLYIPIV